MSCALKPTQNKSSLYPKVDFSNPEANSTFRTKDTSSVSISSSSLYPSIDMKDLAKNLFQEENDDDSASQNLSAQPYEQVLITVPGVMVHLIEKESSVELSCGDLTIVGLKQGENVIAVLTRVGDDIQWPLAKDEAVVRLDESHYFFTLRVPAGLLENEGEGISGDHGENELEVLNYGLTVAAKGQKDLLKKLDGLLDTYSNFTENKVEVEGKWEALDGSVARETSPEELKSVEKKELMEESSAAYWTTLAPNVEDYSGKFAKLIAAGSGQVIRGILWCGDVAVDRLKWGDEFLKRRMNPGPHSEVSPAAMRRVKRVKKLSKMSEKVATGVLSGVVSMSGFFTSSIVSSKAGKKIFGLLPGEIVLAALDGYNKVCDAVEVAGRNVMSTTSVVTTGLVSHKHGEDAAKLTKEGLDAAGHAMAAAWAVFKIRKALDPVVTIKPTSLAKAAAKAGVADLKSKMKK